MCATTGTVHGRGSDELMTSRCVQGGCGSAGPRRLLFLLWVGHGVRGLGQWGWGHSPSFVVEIGAACGSDPVGSVSSLIEWGLESCPHFVWGSRGSLGHSVGALSSKGARGAVEGCGLCAACTDYCASTPIFYCCASLYKLFRFLLCTPGAAEPDPGRRTERAGGGVSAGGAGDREITDCPD